MSLQYKRLLACVVDELAETDPCRLFARIPRADDPEVGFQDISVQSLAYAVNVMCWWIEHTVGGSNTNEPLAYIGSNDVCYCVFTLACHKVGYTPFLPSTRNSDNVHVHLLQEIGCNKLLYNESKERIAAKLKNQCHGLNIFLAPSIKEVLSHKAGNSTYAYSHLNTIAEKNIACIIHSSGSTGISYGFFACLDALSALVWPANRQPTVFYRFQKPVLTTTPFYHIMGFVAFVFSIFHGTPLVYGPEHQLSLGSLTCLIREKEMSQSKKALSCLQKLDCVYVGGAPLADGICTLLQEYTQVITMFGSSELGCVPAMVPEDLADWNYYEWNPYAGVRMAAVSDGMYELVIEKDQKLAGPQAIFHTFPGLEIYQSKDLFTQHPRKPWLWKFCCRQDDIIVQSNGEKFSPVVMENIIGAHPYVANALVVGQSRFHAGLLVEPSMEAQGTETLALVNTIWPMVQRANNSVPAYGRILKGMIRTASQGKAFRKTPKGTVQRQATIDDYATEIDEMYATDSEKNIGPDAPTVLDQDTVTNYVRQTIVEALGHSDFQNTQDFYELGFDSLMSLGISRSLQNGIIRAHRQDLPAATVDLQAIYANATVTRLADYILNLVKGNPLTDTDRSSKLANLVTWYTSGLSCSRVARRPSQGQPLRAVILTGSTGSLGTYLLKELLDSQSTEKIYCLNRSEDAESKQKSSFKSKGIHVNDHHWNSKLEFLHVSMQQDRFGLNESKYDELLGSANAIIHNSWKIDFNLSVESFEDAHIGGVRRLVDFSLSGNHTADIHFISSIGTVGKWTAGNSTGDTTIIPEQPVKDCSGVLPHGYSESKYVSEQVCYEASRAAGVRTTVYRVGQIAGPTTQQGRWNQDEWFPAMIKTSITIGCVPDTLGSMTVDWIPIDLVSAIIMDIIHVRQGPRSSDPCAVYHLQNPTSVSWESLLPPLVQNYEVLPVSLRVWITKLEDIHTAAAGKLQNIPAVKLLGFFKELERSSGANMPILDVQRAMESSAAMKGLKPISASLMDNWLKQWKY
ncbi:acetyl-CoA synthetase-like protein [Aspergillus ambiguus]|uniref:acetyl-CoA synthetase-like protein n=1 Tax=Aspergillus ambiguus TaxID=176160 RepID=UPI003CCD4556